MKFLDRFTAAVGVLFLIFAPAAFGSGVIQASHQLISAIPAEDGIEVEVEVTVTNTGSVDLQELEFNPAGTTLENVIGVRSVRLGRLSVGEETTFAVTVKATDLDTLAMNQEVLYFSTAASDVYGQRLGFNVDSLRR